MRCVVVIAICFGLVAQAAASPWSPLKPLSIASTGLFDGVDGPWSTFGVSIGNPPQSVRLLPANSVNSIWPVVPEGCVVGTDPLNCSDDRGSTFDLTKSTSWNEIGLYELGLFKEGPLGYHGNGVFGFDDVVLGLPGSTLPPLRRQVIEGFATKDIYVGALGLSPAAVNLTTINNDNPSLLTSLFDAGAVPSKSWSYTAGSYEDNISGSLVFGGYDKSRFVPNDLTIPFTPGNIGDVTVGISSVVDQDGTELLPGGPIAAYLDSLVPDMWLPTSACAAFEEAFGLTINNDVGRYLLDSDQTQQLASQNASLTFTIHDPATLELSSERKRSTPTTKNVKITMPYSAFILSARIPFATPSVLPKSPVPYFPLRKADDATKYILGRVFFQNAYVIADYERSTFSVSQALFPSVYDQEDLVAIYRPGDDRGGQSGLDRKSPGNGSLPMGAIVGIAVAIVIVLLLIIAALFLHRRRKKRQRMAQPAEKAPEMSQTVDCGKAELMGNTTHFGELHGSGPGDMYKEMSAEPITYVELPGSEVPLRELDSATTDLKSIGSSELGSDLPTPDLSSANSQRSKSSPFTSSAKDSEDGKPSSLGPETKGLSLGSGKTAESLIPAPLALVKKSDKLSLDEIISPTTPKRESSAP